MPWAFFMLFARKRRVPLVPARSIQQVPHQNALCASQLYIRCTLLFRTSPKGLWNSEQPKGGQREAREVVSGIARVLTPRFHTTRGSPSGSLGLRQAGGNTLPKLQFKMSPPVTSQPPRPASVLLSCLKTNTTHRVKPAVVSQKGPPVSVARGKEVSAILRARGAHTEIRRLQFKASNNSWTA